MHIYAERRLKQHMHIHMVLELYSTPTVFRFVTNICKIDFVLQKQNVK